MPQTRRFNLSRRGFLVAGAVCGIVPDVMSDPGGRDPVLLTAGEPHPLFTVGYFGTPDAVPGFAELLEPGAPEASALSTDAADDRYPEIKSAARLRPLWAEGAARVTVHGLCAGDGPGDFAGAALLVRFPRAAVPAWTCGGSDVTSESGGSSMVVPVDGQTLPVAITFERGVRPAAGENPVGGEEVLAPSALPTAVPLRRGIYFVAGRKPSGALPVWRRCGFARAEPDGRAALYYRGAQDRRGVDFPYLVLSVDRVETV